ncbi:predicted signal transduction protein containing a membrane domain, an EAL and a GGDEF domain [Oceanobacter sp. RED65]|uniref:histidine kinase n=1 Tax=Bermanella marisrubri TaxID=207949 RepID=Q1N1U2_9GAMM|nr:predicted signal transduction protein containing a membrane domain, an EAL and a GGDEF domain [Oceanobacter sp. RED65] [Bermanella marisrubri]
MLVNSVALAQESPSANTSPLFYWVPPEEREISLTEVMHEAQWTVVNGELNFGYLQKELWVMQTINFNMKSDWVVHIPNPFLDYLDLYVLQNRDIVTELHTGDARPFNQRTVKVADFVAGFTAESDREYILVARVRTQGTMMVPIHWMGEEEYAERLAIDQIIYGGYYGALIIIALYHLFIFLVVRETGYIFYVASMFAFVLLQLAYDGRGFAWFWPSNPEFNAIAFPLFYSLYQFINLMFISVFLRLRQNNPNWHKYLLVLKAIVIINSVLILALPYHTITPIIIITGITGLISGVVSGAFRWWQGFTPARYFTIAWLFFLGGLLLANFRGFGMVETSWVSQYGYLIGSLMLALFLAFSLAERIKSANVAKRITEKKLIDSQQQHLSVLKRYQELYENAPIGHFQSNSQYQLTSVNLACARLFGFDHPREMLEQVKDIRKYLISDFSYFQDRVRDTRKEGVQKDVEIKIKDIVGKQRWLSINMRYWPEGDTYEGSIQDVTERKIADELRRDLDQERLNIMERFSLGMAEEIDTPLGSNVAATGFIQEGLDSLYAKKQQGIATIEDYEQLLEICRQSLQLTSRNQRRVIRVVKRFREVASQHIGLVASHFNLVNAINQTVEGQRWKMAGWRVYVDGPEKLTIYSYKRAISAILIQLIDNALAHSEADKKDTPTIWIRVEILDDSRISLTVTDNGKGVDRETAKDLGQPFFTTKKGPDGHIGLGLYMIYNLTNRSLNGRLLFPITGEGFSVQIHIPISLPNKQ